MAVSSAVYFLCSRAVRAELAGGEYRRSLFAMFFSSQHGPLVEPVVLDGGAVAAIVVLVASAVVFGVLMRRATRSPWRDGLPEILTYAMASIVVPPLAVALVMSPDGRGFMTTPVLLTLSVLMNLAIVPIALKGPRVERSSEEVPRERLGGWPLLFVAMACIYGLVVIITALNSLRGFDGLAYHLPMARSWLRHSRFTTNVEESATFFFPANAEIFLRWMLSCGSDRFAFVPAFLESIGSLYLIHKIGREIGQTRSAALMAAMSAASCVLLAFLAATAYVDAFVVFTLLLAVVHLLRLLRSPDRTTSIAFGIAIGLAIGSKYSAILPALVMTAIWLVPVMKAKARPYEGCLHFLSWRAVVRQVSPFAIAAALCSGYWYVRNALEHGNPVFPFAVLGLHGLPITTLIYVRPGSRSVIEWLMYPWRESRSLAYDELIGGAFAGIAIVGLVAATLRRKENRHRDIVVLITIASFVLWLSTGTFVPRYGIFPVLLSFVFVGDLLTRHRATVLRVIIGLVVGATFFIFGRGLLQDAVYVAMIGRPRYGVPRAIDRLARATILNATSAQANYYLMGSDARHEVISLFRAAQPEDLLRLRADYVLVALEQDASYRRTGLVEFVAASEAGDRTPAVLYRIRKPFGRDRR